MNSLDDGDPAPSCARRSALVDGKALQGAGDLQRGRATSRSAPTSASRSSPPTSRSGWRSRAQIYEGQQVFKALKYAPFPVVGAPSGMALGGGCEILLHCDAVQAHAETYMGLVEVGVGVIPGWGGCKEMTTRWATNPEAPRRTDARRRARPSRRSARPRSRPRPRRRRRRSSCVPSDGITMNRDRLLADAKAKALALVAAGYTAAGAGRDHACPARPARRRSTWRSPASAPAAPRRRTTSWSRGGSPTVLTGGDTDVRPRPSPRTTSTRSSARPSSTSSDSGHARPDRAHARNRQAPEELAHAHVQSAPARPALRLLRAVRRRGPRPPARLRGGHRKSWSWTSSPRWRTSATACCSRSTRPATRRAARFEDGKVTHAEGLPGGLQDLPRGRLDRR